MGVEWPKGFGEWALFLALLLGVSNMYLYERPTSFQFLVILLLLAIFNRLSRKEVTNHTSHIKIKFKK